MIEPSRELLAVGDVWELVSEPYHLPDWCPAYTGVDPDRRGLADGGSLDRAADRRHAGCSAARARREWS